MTGRALIRTLTLCSLVLGCSRAREPVSEATAPSVAEEVADRPCTQPADAGLPYEECPQTGSELDAYLDTSTKLYDRGKFAAAYSCARIAVDLMPTAVEAHQLYGAALAALGEYSRAQLAFSTALAIEPDDAETLVAVADFYINIFPKKSYESTVLGLAYADRGAARAARRHRSDKRLRARLALLQAEALTDLGRAAEALTRVDQALELAPRLQEAVFERAVALYHLGRFEESRALLETLIAGDERDAFAHFQLALVLEAAGDEAGYQKHLARARALAPERFSEIVVIGDEEFEGLVDEVVTALPAEDRKLLESVRMELARSPSSAELTLADPPFSPAIVGLFQRGGTVSAVGGRAMAGRNAAASTAAGEKGRIKLYSRNLARLSANPAELRAQIRRTLRHELGHVRGWDEAEVRRRGLD